MPIEMGREAGERIYLGTMADVEAKNDPHEQVFRAHNAAGHAITDYDAARKLVESDETLSPVGKAAKLQTATTEYLKRLDTVQVIADRAARAADEAEAALVVAGKPTDPAQTVRDGEIRSWFAAQDRATQMSVVSSGIESRDVETLAAILSAPKAMKLLPDAIANHARRQMLEIQHGAKLEAIERQRRIAVTAQFGISEARKWIKRTAGITESPADRLRRVEGR